MKNKGFTLVEIIIVMGLAFLMVGAIDSILISYVKSHNISVLQDKEFNYLNEAIAIIDREVNMYAVEVKTEGNILNISYFKGTSPKYIKRVSGKIYILSNADGKSNKNTIVDGVKDFMAVKSGKNLYIKISLISGASIERCLTIENAN